MAERKFELPGIQDLTKEQELVRALPHEGQHVVVGGPGTGKSVMALLRSRQLAHDSAPYVFLVYTHLLHQASNHLYGETLVSKTWYSWISNLFSEVCEQRIPTKESGAGSSFRPIDWEAALDVVYEAQEPLRITSQFLVIDEGQDMPPQFYEMLVAMGFENFFVACDQSQQITEEHSSRREIEASLGLEPSESIELSYNHRNALPVAALAREFYTGDPASPPPELPQRPRGRAGVPELWHFEKSEHGYEQVAQSILSWADRNPSRLIGVIAPNNKVRERYCHELNAAAENMVLEQGTPTIETFYGKVRPEVAFDQGGILVINAQACKGLEFDDVMLADIDQHFLRAQDPDPTRKRFYVMISRARENVFMFHPKDQVSPILRLMPADSAILKRRRL